MDKYKTTVKYPPPPPPKPTLKDAILNIGFREPVRPRNPAQFNSQTLGVQPRRKSRATDLPIILAAIQRRERRAEKRGEWVKSMGIFGNKSAIWVQTPNGTIANVRSLMVRRGNP